MDENDSVSEYIKIPLGHSRTNGTVYSKIYFKVRSALHFRYSKVIPRFVSLANIAQSIITITTTVFLSFLTTTIMFIVTI